MPGLDDVQKRADEMPSGSDFNSYPTVRLLDGDVAIFRFVGNGESGDPLVDSAYFHMEQRISKKTNKPYQARVWCPRSDGDADMACSYCNGEHGPDAQKVRLRIGIWLWVYYIIRANQNKEALTDPNKAYPVVTTPDGRKVFMEEINGPMVYERGPGRGNAFISELKLIRDIQGGLNKIRFSLRRSGSDMNNTAYQIIPDPKTVGEELTDEQKEIMAELPAISEILSGRQTWPLSATSTMIDINSLTTLEGEPVAEGKKSVF